MSGLEDGDDAEAVVVGFEVDYHFFFCGRCNGRFGRGLRWRRLSLLGLRSLVVRGTSLMLCRLWGRRSRRFVPGSICIVPRRLRPFSVRFR